jgi:hypothetical protein
MEPVTVGAASDCEDTAPMAGAVLATRLSTDAAERPMLPVAFWSIGLAEPDPELKGLLNGLSEKRPMSELQAPSAPAIKTTAATRLMTEERRHSYFKRISPHRRLRNTTYWYD